MMQLPHRERDTTSSPHGLQVDGFNNHVRVALVSALTLINGLSLLFLLLQVLYLAPPRSGGGRHFTVLLGKVR